MFTNFLIGGSVVFFCSYATAKTVDMRYECREIRLYGTDCFVENM